MNLPFIAKAPQIKSTELVPINLHSVETEGVLQMPEHRDKGMSQMRKDICKYLQHRLALVISGLDATITTKDGTLPAFDDLAHRYKMKLIGHF